MSRSLLALGLTSSLVLGSLALAPNVARARPPQLSDGGDLGLTVGTSGEVFALNHFPDRGFDMWFGVRSTNGSAFSAAGGFLPYLVPDLVIGLTLGNIVIGARFEAGFYHVNPDGALATDINVGYLGIIPLFEYWFEGQDMAPFIGVFFGPSVIFPDSADPEVWLEGGGRGGLAFFVGDSFSIAPTAAFSFMYDSSSERAGWGLVIGFDLRGWAHLGGGGGGGGAGAAGGGDPAYTAPPASAPISDDPEAGFE